MDKGAFDFKRVGYQQPNSPRSKGGVMTKEQINRLIETVEFYADPSTYFAIAFFPDHPCGDFIKDFSETELGRKPGRMARECLAALEAVKEE